MRILTITCHRPYNYGAVLQTYALQHYLESQGVETAVIDYNPDYQKNKHKGNFIKSLIWKLYRLPDFIVAKRVFGDFLDNYIRLTRQYKSLEELTKKPPKADGMIAGSDQIWNYSFHQDGTYYLSFAPHNCFKASYAASIAQDSIPEHLKPVYQSRLSDFKKIAVREQTGANLLNEIGLLNVTTVLDPVFLLSEEEWMTQIADCKFIDRGYVLLYAFNCTNAIANYAKELAKKHGKKLYIINTMINDYRFGCDHHFWNCSPTRFVSLMHNADEVVTNSFHGLSFSIIFKKQVHVFSKHTGGNSRLFDLMKDLNMPNCKEGFVIDYDKVYEVLIDRIKHSKSVISEIIS